MIHADGRRLYRVLQNALHDSLAGSRVYLTLARNNKKVRVCTRNISKEELTAEVDFTQRLVRGDKSRSDGGSGLGLSIAQSFIEACGGEFKVEAEEDRFTATVSFLLDDNQKSETVFLKGMQKKNNVFSVNKKTRRTAGFG